jgi:hypothetical protein
MVNHRDSPGAGTKLGVMGDLSVPRLASLGPTACIVGALFAAPAMSSAANAADGQRALTIYSVATSTQLIKEHHNGQRGWTPNPFNPNPGPLEVVPREGNGPFPGDATIASFNLYTSASFNTKVGTARYTCHHGFKPYASCNAKYFLVKSGTLSASGRVDFEKTSFTLAITSGTGKYVGANGQVATSPVTSNRQRLEFDLLG